MAITAGNIDEQSTDLGSAVLVLSGRGLGALMAYPKRPAILLASLLAYCGMIEVLQSFTPDRMAEWADLLADALGLAVGWGVMRLVSHKRRE